MCTRVLWNTNEIAVLTGRSMDWPESTEPLVVAFPRGRQRDGGLMGPEVVVPDNPLRWTSRYASLATTVYGLGTVDGLNERGLAVHGLYLEATDVGPRDPGRPGLHTGLWAQYLLDQAATVSEALALMDGVQLVDGRRPRPRRDPAPRRSRTPPATRRSWSSRRASSSSTTGREFTLDDQRSDLRRTTELLAAQDFSHPSRDMPLPGNVNAVDRFQRAAYYSALLPEPTDERQAVAGVMAIMRNVLGAVRRALRRIRRLQHRVPHGERPDPPHLLTSS